MGPERHFCFGERPQGCFTGPVALLLPLPHSATLGSTTLAALPRKCVRRRLSISRGRGPTTQFPQHIQRFCILEDIVFQRKQTASLDWQMRGVRYKYQPSFPPNVKLIHSHAAQRHGFISIPIPLNLGKSHSSRSSMTHCNQTDCHTTGRNHSNRLKPLIYRVLQIFSWIFATLVGLGLVIMFDEYFAKGAGAASPFGRMTVWDLLVNSLLWVIPTVLLLWLVHCSRVRTWFL